MLSHLALLAFLSLLAGRVCAFSILVNNQNLTATQILAIPNSPVVTACASNCSVASGKIATCKNSVPCLCSVDTVSSLHDCETCMLHNLIATNTKAPDFRAGSNVVMGAYGTACQSQNIALPANLTSLTLPSKWDGPFVAVLPLGGVVATVAIGAFLGLSALYILANLS